MTGVDMHRFFGWMTKADFERLVAEKDWPTQEWLVAQGWSFVRPGEYVRDGLSLRLDNPITRAQIQSMGMEKLLEKLLPVKMQTAEIWALDAGHSVAVAKNRDGEYLLYRQGNLLRRVTYAWCVTYRRSFIEAMSC